MKSITNNFLRGSAITTLSTAISISLHFFSIMLLTRYLPKSDMGLYVLFITVITIASDLSGLGLNMALVKNVSSEDESEKRGILTSIIVMRLAALSAMVLIFVIFGRSLATTIDEKFQSLNVFVPLAFILTNIKDFFYCLFQGLNIFKKYGVIQIAVALLKLSLVFLFLRQFDLSLIILIYIEIFVLVVTIACQVFMTPKHRLNFSNPKFSLMKSLAKFSIPLYFNNIFTLVINRVNIFIIGIYLAVDHIALFNIAGQIPMALTRLFAAVMIVYFPNISKLYSLRDNERVNHFMNKSLILFSSFILFFLLACSLFRHEIITIIFSEKYLPSSTSFVLLMIAFYFQAITNILGKSIVAAGHSSIPFRANVVSSALGIICSLLLIPKLGFNGAAYSIIIMRLISYGIHYRYAVKYKFNPKLLQFSIPLIIGMTLFLLYLPMPDTILVKSIFSFLYIFFAWILIKDFRGSSKSAYKYLQYLIINKLRIS